MIFLKTIGGLIILTVIYSFSSTLFLFLIGITILFYIIKCGANIYWDNQDNN